MGKIPDLVSAGVWGPIFTLNLKFWIAQELRRNIEHPRELVIFSIHFPKIPKICLFLIFGPSWNVHDPQNQLFLSLDPPNYLKKYKKQYLGIFEKYDLGNFSNPRNCFLESTCAWKSLRSVWFFSKILNIRSISFKKHEMDILDFSIQLKELKHFKVIFYFQWTGPALGC